MILKRRLKFRFSRNYLVTVFVVRSAVWFPRLSTNRSSPQNFIRLQPVRFRHIFSSSLKFWIYKPRRVCGKVLTKFGIHVRSFTVHLVSDSCWNPRCRFPSASNYCRRGFSETNIAFNLKYRLKRACSNAAVHSTHSRHYVSRRYIWRYIWRDTRALRPIARWRIVHKRLSPPYYISGIRRTSFVV